MGATWVKTPKAMAAPIHPLAFGTRTLRRMLLAALALLALVPWARGQDAEMPRPRWTTYVGGRGDDRVLAVAKDGFGHIYVAGRTSDSLLLGNDTTGASGYTHQRHFGGGASDAFLAKYRPQGSMMWCTYFGGMGDDEAVQIVTLGDTGVYVVGNTTSTDSIATDTLAWQTALGGGQDIFVAYFNWNGTLAGSTYFGGPGDETATGAALDVSGRLVVCGFTAYAHAFPDGLAPQRPWTAGEDGLLVRFKGTALADGGTYFGGAGNDRLVQVAYGDSSGNVMIGNTESATGIATANAFTPQPQGGRDAFLMKVDSNLAVVYGSYFGGEGDDAASSIVRHGDTLAIGGATTSQVLYTTGNSLQPHNGGASDGFLALLDSSFALHWSTFVGDTGQDVVAAVFIDDEGNLYATGTTTSGIGIAAHADSAGGQLSGPEDAFLLRFNSTGDSLDWSRYIGAMDKEEAQAMTVMGHTAIYIGGRTASTAGFVKNPHQPGYGGGPWDGFATRLDRRISTIGGISNCSGGGGGGGNNVPPPQTVYHVCLGDSIMFIIYGGALGFDSEWVWYADSCGVNHMFLTQGDTIVLHPDHSFTLYVRAESTDMVTTCGHADIVVHPLPVPVIMVSDTVCAGAPISVSGTGAESFMWLLGDSVVATGSAAQFTAPMTPGTITVTGAGTNGPACTVNATQQVVVLSAPGVDWQVTPIGCAGEPGMIALSLPDSSTSDSTALTLVWQTPGYAGPLLTGLAAGNYVATLTDTLLGCSRTDTLRVVAPPTLGMHWAVTNISCAGDPGSIALVPADSTVAGSPLSIQWSDPLLQGPIVDNLSAGLYVATVSDTLGCSRTDSLRILLPPTIMATWQITGTSCHGGADGSIALQHPDTALSDSAFLWIQWAQPGLQGPGPTGLSAGAYVATITDTMGCSRTDTLVVPQPPPLMDSVATTLAYCGKATGTAQVISAGNASGLVFNFGNGPGGTGFRQGLTPGSYSVSATDSAGCQQVLGFTIGSIGNITASIGPDTLWADSSGTWLICALSPPDSLATFVWAPPTGLATPTAASTWCMAADTMRYIVHATSAYGCSAFDTVVVIPWPASLMVPVTDTCGSFFLPGIFSPNGDGLNDELCLMGGCITAAQWAIYDRWGGRLFTGTTPEACWDGTRNGMAVPAGVYLYTLHVERRTGGPIERTGTITLMR